LAFEDCFLVSSQLAKTNIKHMIKHRFKLSGSFQIPPKRRCSKD
jgi:hypothetical protein